MKSIDIKSISALTTDQTTSLFAGWSQANVASLESVIINYGDFTSDDAATALQNFVAAASALSYLNIDDQVSTRPVTVAVTPASSSSPTANTDGSIVVSNALTGEEITSTTTQRTNTLTVALGGDIYNMMRFTAQGSIDFNDNFSLDYLSAPVQTTCA